MRRAVSVALAFVIAASTACTTIKQDALSVAPTVRSTPTTTPKAATSFKATSINTFHGGSVVSIPNDGAQDEAAIHALAATPDGWVAVGSMTSTLNPGFATVWRVGNDGKFGEAEMLPSARGVEPSFARDVMTFGGETFAVGRTGAGRSAVATAWFIHADGLQEAVALPNDDDGMQGTTGDVPLRLDDGTLVVVGRGDGPFFTRLLLWSSSDGGQSWSMLRAPTPAYLEPLAATDGTRVAVLSREANGRDGFDAYRSAVFVHGADGLELQAQEDIDPTPGARYWPRDLLWDGSAFVAGFDTEEQTALATSVDGLTYTVAPMVLPGTQPDLASILGLVLVDGALEVFIFEEDRLLVFRNGAEGWVHVDIPSVPPGEMHFLARHEPLATDGHRVAYLAERRYSRALLVYDGVEWLPHYLPLLPIHRNDTRLDVREIASAAGSDLALLDHSQEVSKGSLHATPVGLLWRPDGHTDWEQLDIEGRIDQPQVIAPWDKQFVVGNYDALSNETQMWRFDPAVGEFARMGSVSGQAVSLVSARDGLYALSAGELWMSPDGNKWSEVALPAEPTALCSNGVKAVTVWSKPQGKRDEFGVHALHDGVATVVGPPVTSRDYEIVADVRDLTECALNSTYVVETHHGYDGVLAEDVPVFRLSPLHTGLRDEQVLLHMMSRGSDESWIDDIAADGDGWVAVGSARDTESSMDAVVWRSDEGLVWRPAETIAGGPGNQIAWTVTIRDGQLLVGGLDGQQAKIWVLPR